MINSTKTSSDLTSILMCCYDFTQWHRRITEAALGNIEMYTDKEDYELILIDNEPCVDLEQKYHCFNITHHIKLEKDIGYSASMNLGATYARGHYLCLIHNDVFVWEGWLTKLKEVLEKEKLDLLYPAQGYITREQVKRSYQGIKERLWDDAGLLFMKSETFQKIGGYDKRFWSMYHDYVIRQKILKAGLSADITNQVLITHIGAVTVYYDADRFNKFRGEEGLYLQDYA